MLLIHKNKLYFKCNINYEFYVVDNNKNIKKNIVQINELNYIPIDDGDFIIEVNRRTEEIMVVEVDEFYPCNHTFSIYRGFYDITYLKYFITNYEEILNKEVKIERDGFIKDLLIHTLAVGFIFCAVVGSIIFLLKN